MKRIYYGSVTIDVADQLADRVLQTSAALAGRENYRGVARSGGFYGSEPYSVGRVAVIRLASYINDSDQASAIEVVIGAGIPIAAAPSYPSRVDPPDTDYSLRLLEPLLPREETG